MIEFSQNALERVAPLPLRCGRVLGGIAGRQHRFARLGIQWILLVAAGPTRHLTSWTSFGDDQTADAVRNGTILELIEACLQLRSVKRSTREVPLQRSSLEFTRAQRIKIDTHQDKLVVFSNATKPVCSSVTTNIVECDRRNEGRVSLTSSDHSLFPWRINSY